MPICCVCSRNFKNLSSHINAKHCLSKSEYLSLYPGSKIVDDELSARFSLRTRRMHARLKEENPTAYAEVRKATCKRMREIKGPAFRHTAVSKKKMRASHLGVLRRPHSAETKEKIRESKIGKAMHLSLESKESKTNKQKQRWAERKADGEIFAQYVELLSKRRKEYIREHGHNTPKKGRKTSLEVRVESFLVEHKVDYTFQYFLEGKFYDFFLPEFNLLLEVDGEYWHRMLPAIKNDIEKHVLAKDQQIKLLRITEKQWYPALIFEKDYSIIQKHNFDIMNQRTMECLNYEISTLLI